MYFCKANKEEEKSLFEVDFFYIIENFERF